ncbi:MAG: aminotransferase class I/II-fold pyridoxal phosphate-dependent enzyme [Oscillospiraceae bacterium]|nr:aminotransferase class I/II-fold pyridoxal phosphate-dependent enzyme [Oscillospiraceae bacterium]
MIDYDKFLSPKVTSIPKSGIRKFFAIADEMKDVANLTVGEPDFVTPRHIREEAIESLKKGQTHYGANNGIFELRSEIDRYLQRRFGIGYDPKSEIIVTVGGSEAIDLAVRAILAPGDEAIVPLPSFVCYAPLVSLAGASPVIVRTKMKDQFKLTPKDLKAAITKKTKLLVLPFPNNPTGAVMEKNELEEIAKIAKEADILVLSDEIYAELSYGFKHASFAGLPDMRERTILVNGFSKTYAMTGWRLGYACAPEPILSQMAKIHQYGIMCAPRTSQSAGIAALKDGDADIEYMKNDYDGRRKIIYEGLKQIGMDCFEPKGAFYIFPSIEKFGLPSYEFCERLLLEEKVAVVPGTAFGEPGEGFIRICYAYSISHINKALEKIEKFIKKIK